MFSEKANIIFKEVIEKYHIIDRVDQDFSNPYDSQSQNLEHLLYRKCWIDTVQWHYEDIIRDPNIDPKSALTLKRQIDASNQDRTDMVEYIDSYFRRYPGVKEYMDQTRENARQNGYVSTVFGRRLYLPEINSKNHQRRQYAERSAINAPMQGTAADIIKLAMLQVDKWLQKKGLDARLIMQVHDELILEVSEADAEKHAQEIINIMESAATLDVKLKVECGIGDNWDEAH